MFWLESGLVDPLPCLLAPFVLDPATFRRQVQHWYDLVLVRRNEVEGHIILCRIVMSPLPYMLYRLLRHVSDRCLGILALVDGTSHVLFQMGLGKRRKREKKRDGNKKQLASRFSI